MKAKVCPWCKSDIRIYYSSSTRAFYATHSNSKDDLNCPMFMPLIIRKCESLSEATTKWNSYTNKE